MDRTWIVYIHTNKTNGKKYVGITSQGPNTRWMNGKGYDKRLRFGRAIAKYGWDNFSHDIIYEGLSEQDAKRIEVELIAELRTQDIEYGYNMTKGGDGACGYHHTEETRKKLSEFQTGEKHVNYGRHLSQETKDKIGRANKGNKYCLGIVRSEETKSKMAQSKYKPVAMFDGDSLIRVFCSAKQAQEETGVSRKNISLCCLGKRKHAGGYAWSFA